MIILATVLLVIVVYMMVFKKKSVKKSVEKPKVESGKIYGAMSCPHTVKQIEKYPGYEFIDCSVTGGCPSFVTAYPTTKHPSGDIEVGVSN